jgi:hypothetical protein
MLLEVADELATSIITTQTIRSRVGENFNRPADNWLREQQR